MNKDYKPSDIEPKWSKVWDDTKLYQADNNSTKPKWYQLEYFPYPSGVTMHVGHVRNYVMSDAFGRFKRMQGHNVLHPMGWDAFGLPAENQAIKTKTSPRASTDANIKVFKRQLGLVGLSYDWSREIDSSQPDYYRWTQWLFLLFYKRKLAYKAEASVNWCPQDKTVLANEQVIKTDGKNVCERCGHEVEKRLLNQWFFKITEYADRLLADLKGLDWPQSIKVMQENWIGRSEGMLFTAPVKDTKLTIQTFSAHFEAFRADTFVVIAPDHPFLPELVKGTKDERKVLDAAAKMAQKRDVQGYTNDEEVEGIFTGRYIVDPVGNGDLPIWVASYALAQYGTGIVKCSAHDERDFRFAKKYDIPLKPVLFPEDSALAKKVAGQEVCYTDMQNGTLTEPHEFKDKTAGKVRGQIIEYLKAQKLAEPKVSYKMRDWLISRQRYWGAPIPIVYCDKCGVVPVPEKDLPVVLPEVDDYLPDGSGKSPLAKVKDWVNTTCPQCDGPATRETDTMDTFVDSSWYFLRFADPHNDQAAFDPKKVAYWLPVDSYVGGAEHAVAHLLFARFWTKVLADEGLINFNEPFKQLRNQGMIGGADGRKMGKRYGNVVTPDDLIDKGYGADALRLYESFIGPYNQGVDWNPNGIDGTFRFIKRVWTLVYDFTQTADRRPSSDSNSELETALLAATHRSIKKVTDDIGDFGFNTAVAALMELVNELYKLRVDLPYAAALDTWHMVLSTLVQLLSPFAPFAAEELWQALGGDTSVHVSTWPKYEEKYVTDDLIEVPVQVNGKLRDTITISPGTSEAELEKLAGESRNVKRHLEGKQIVKTIVVPRKLVNFVVK